MRSIVGVERRIWLIGGIGVATLVCVPILTIFFLAFRDDSGVWSHLVETRLSEYAFNTAALVFLVCAMSLILGTVPAWLVTACRFPGRHLLGWLLLLPLAVPPYLSAYAYADFFQQGGPFQGLLRSLSWWPLGIDWFSGFRSMYGAAAVLAFALSPYVYICARQAFQANVFLTATVGRTLGKQPAVGFFLVSLPIAWSSILGGLVLVGMETLADFGVADYCAVDTLTTGVYRSWLGFDSPPAAARLSLLLLLAVAAFIVSVRILAGKPRSDGLALSQSQTPMTVGKGKASLCIFFCTIPVLVGFVLPSFLFVRLAIMSASRPAIEDISRIAWQTLTLASIGSAFTVLLGIVIAYSRRLHNGPLSAASFRISTFGYTIPGPVVAIGVLIPLVTIDHFVNEIFSLKGESSGPGLILSGSLVAVTLGCVVRFLSVSGSTIRAALQGVSRSMDAAAGVLGSGPTATLFRIHLPICRRAILAAALLVFADIVKELPMTLLLRPFHFETLAVMAYQYASDERLEQAALTSLGMIGIGVLPVLFVASTLYGQDSLSRSTQPPRS